MSAAIHAKSARARATIARNMLVKNTSGNLGRAFDDCFEMGDGGEVLRLLEEKMKTDLELRAVLWRFSRYFNAEFMAKVRALPYPTQYDLLGVQIERFNRKCKKFQIEE